MTTPCLFIGVDPGINSPAFVVLDEQRKILHKIRFKAKRAQTVAQKLWHIQVWWNKFWKATAVHNVMPYFLIEEPGLQRSEAGMACAEKGGLTKLSGSWGVLMAGAFEWVCHVDDVHSISVQKWKGQVPKHITRKRMEERFEIDSSWNHDEVDALALANYLYENLGTKALPSSSFTRAHHPDMDKINSPAGR